MPGGAHRSHFSRSYNECTGLQQKDHHSIKGWIAMQYPVAFAGGGWLHSFLTCTCNLKVQKAAILLVTSFVALLQFL